MKVLVLRGRLPYPLDYGASIRTYNLLKALADKHEITFLTYSDTPADEENSKYLREFCKEVILIPRGLKKNKPNILLRLCRNIFEKYPYSVAISHSAAMTGAVKNILARESFDLVHADTLHVSSNLMGLKTPPRILNQHNVENVILRRIYEIQSNPVARAFWRSQWRRLYAFESLACRRFNRLIAVSDEDMDKLAKIAPGVPIDVVPNGVDIEYFTPNNVNVDKEGLVFTGALDWHANEDALIYFLNDIYPLILSRKPNLKLTIVGKNPSAKLKTLCGKFASVVLTGRVPDVRPYIFNSEVYIVPLRVGGGTRLKILEAMAAEIPLVSTEIGCEGIKVSHQKNILIADSPSDFSEQVLKILDDEKLGRALTAEAKKTVLEEYDWRIIAERLNLAWENCVRSPYDYEN
ncbi:MAG: glycosyltransferase [Candidatus Zixiibacteriota bacterium]|nr:MAG: glycosyltransferase [candidate division Zixibacteria bacterium]